MLCGSMPRRRSLAALLFGVLAVAGCGTASTTSPGSTPTLTAAATATPRAGGAVSVIAASGSTCSQFASGTLGSLNRLRYTSSGGKVTGVTPSTFDYWVKVVSAAAPPTTVTVNESTHGGGPALSATGGDVFRSGAGATCVPLSNSVSYSAGLTAVTFTGSPGGTYLVQVHLSAAAFVGHPVGSGAAGLTVSTAGVTGSSRDLPLAGG